MPHRACSFLLRLSPINKCGWHDALTDEGSLNGSEHERRRWRAHSYHFVIAAWRQKMRAEMKLVIWAKV